MISRLSDKYHDQCEEKLGENNSIVKTPSKLNPVVQPKCVDLTSRCPVNRSKNRHFCPTFDVIGHCVKSGSGPEGSKGTDLILRYVDARPRPYLVETKSRSYIIVNILESIQLLLSSENWSLTLHWASLVPRPSFSAALDVMYHQHAERKVWKLLHSFHDSALEEFA